MTTKQRIYPNSRNRKITYTVAIATCFLAACVTIQQRPHQQEPYTYSVIERKHATIHVVQINVAQYEPRLYNFPDGLQTVSNQAKQVDADIAVNGSFFELNGNPAGVFKTPSGFVCNQQRKPRGVLAWQAGKPLNAIITRATVRDGQVLPVWHDKTTTTWSAMDFITGGTPVLVKDHQVRTDLDQERVSNKFLKEANARTAVCMTKRNWILFVVDGRPRGSEEGSRGLTLQELAEVTAQHGCRDTVNLDGGSSSTLYIKGKTKNRPKHSIERPVANMLYFKKINKT